MTFLKFLLLIASIGMAGWSVRYLISPKNEDRSGTLSLRLVEYFKTFLTGFGFASIVLFFIALAGFFELEIIFIAFLIPAVVYFVTKYFRKRGLRLLQLSYYLVCCLIFGCVCFGLGKIAKPFEAVIQADDASVYIGSAFRLANSGSLTYEDPLVLEMTPQERNQVFDNRFVTDTTGEKIRFPGGARLSNSSKGTIVFSFYHLFPIWLALGIQSLGQHSFLNILSVFFALKLLSLFFLARVLGGWLLGISVPVVCFFFYPQLYFALMPTSELLAETLFLSGLLTLVAGSKLQPSMNSNEQWLVGILWGALFLCRLESLYILSLTLVLVFTTIPALTRDLSRWRILILQLVFFAFTALYYQVARGEYLYVLTSGHYLRNQTLVHITIELLGSATKFVESNPFFALLAFLGGTAIVMGGVWRLISAIDRSHRFWLKAGIGIFLVGILLAPMFAPWVSVVRVVRHLRWIALYFSPPILLTLFAGILFYLYKKLREPNRSITLAIFILFCLPAVVYVIRPMVNLDQPWGTRKFVPMIFPLFFVISLCGWQDYFKFIFNKSQLVAKSAFCFLISLMTLFFLGRSQYLLTDNLFSDLIVQTRKLAENIPQNGLIVIPESWAGMHLQMPLQYLEEFDTILLPVEKSRNNKLLPYVESFLSRQIKKRPVVILLKSPYDPPLPLRNSFNLKFGSKMEFAFLHVPQKRQFIFPERSEKVILDVSIFNLTSKVNTYRDRLGIRYDDPNVSFVNFFDKENGFRWTQQRSTIQGFVFQIDTKVTAARISTCFLPSQNEVNDGEIQVLINDRFPAPFARREGTDFIFDIDQTTVPEISSFTIFSKTFSPSEKGINLDPRQLGICFNELTIHSVR